MKNNNIETIETKKIKTLANCNAVDFMKQTNKIRKEIKEYLDLTQIMEIRKRVPAKQDRESIEKQGKENLNDILDKILEEYPEQSVKILGLMCFIEDEKELQNMKGVDLLAPALELISSKAVIDFFSSWVR